MTRIAVIGGGWAGLAAAVEAVSLGAAVTLFEMAPTLGGRARSLDELYQTGIRPHEIARTASLATLRRLFPHLSERQARELATLLNSPQVQRMLADTWGDPASTTPIQASSVAVSKRRACRPLRPVRSALACAA